MTKAIWKKKSLLRLIKQDETFHEFVMFAGFRAKETNLSIHHCDFTALPYLEIINDGKFNFHSKKILNDFKYYEKNNRKSKSNFENLIMLLKYSKLYIYSILPINIKKILVNNEIIGYKKKYNNYLRK